MQLFSPQSAANANHRHLPDKFPATMQRRLAQNQSEHKMPPSMRRQSALAKRRTEKAMKEKETREEAVKLLRKGGSIRAVAEECQLSKSTVGRLARAVKVDDKENLLTLLNPQHHLRGRPTVWTQSEANQINKRIKFAAENGFAVDMAGIKQTLQKICSDGRKGYSTCGPSDAAIRTYRAKNRALTYRKTENKDGAKLRAENYEDVKTLSDRLKEVEAEHPDIFTDPMHLWNMDETHVDGEFGERIKVFSGSESHHGGFTSVCKGSGKHMTAILAASASGKLAPLFIIAAGKNVMEAWTKPLSKKDFVDRERGPHWLTNDHWLPGDTVLRCTENGSVDKKTMPFVLQHIDSYVRQFVPARKPYVLLLDGHSSRKGIEWVEVAEERNIILILLPANTTHFLQPCDSDINKRFQRGVRTTRDEVLRLAKTNVHAMGFKLKLAVAAHHAIREEDVRNAFIKTKLWPMDYRFCDELKRSNKPQERYCRHLAAISDGGPSLGARSTRVRQSDRQTMQEIEAIFKSDAAPDFALRDIVNVLKERETVASILKGIRPSPVANTAGYTKRVLACGAPATHHTVAGMIARRQQLEDEKRLVQQQKAADKQAKALQRQIEKEQAEREKARRAEQRLAKRAEKRERDGLTAVRRRAGESLVVERVAKRPKHASEASKSGSRDVAEALVELASGNC